MSDYMQGNADNAVAVPFSDDESDKDKSKIEDLEEDSPTATPEERVTRKQKRQARIQSMLQEGKQSKEELAALRNEQANTRAELAQLRGYVAAQQQQRAPANDVDGKDPYERRLDSIYERQSEAYNAAQAELKAGTFTAERQAHYERVAREIESAKTAVHTERVVDSRTHAQRAETAQQVWVQKYPDVYNNKQAFQYASATYQRRLALGEHATNDMVDEIMNETLTTFRLGKVRSAPSASERSRMSGLPSAGGGGGGSKSGIVMNPTFKKMATAAYPDLSEAEAERKWVNGPGKRLREKKVL
jgi:hypothetical protein